MKNLMYVFIIIASLLSACSGEVTEKQMETLNKEINALDNQISELEERIHSMNHRIQEIEHYKKQMEDQDEQLQDIIKKFDSIPMHFDNMTIDPSINDEALKVSLKYLRAIANNDEVSLKGTLHSNVNTDLHLGKGSMWEQGHKYLRVKEMNASHLISDVYSDDEQEAVEIVIQRKDGSLINPVMSLIKRNSVWYVTEIK